MIFIIVFIGIYWWTHYYLQKSIFGDIITNMVNQMPRFVYRILLFLWRLVGRCNLVSSETCHRMIRFENGSCFCHGTIC